MPFLYRKVDPERRFRKRERKLIPQFLLVSQWIDVSFTMREENMNSFPTFSWNAGKPMNGLLLRLMAFSALVTMVITTAPTSAAGVNLTLTPTASSSSPQNIQMQWTASGQYVTGTTITVTTSPSFVSITDSCTSTEIDLNNDGNSDGSITATSTNTATYTVTTSTGATLTMNLCLQYAFSASATNYALSFLSSNPVDFGSALFYANGGNQVTVTATVPASLDFSIRNSGDTANTNTCALGTLSLSATSTCAYRLRVATNAANGFQTQIQANHDFGTGAATMTNVVNDGSQPSAGTELYGITLFQSASVGGRNTSTGLFTEAAVENNPALFTFGTDPSPIPTSSAQNFLSYGSAFQTGNAPSNTSTNLVMHGASISAGTAAGSYSQVVTYTVTGSF
jgi:hypothetical protein